MTIITIKANGKISRVHYEDAPSRLTLAHVLLIASIAVMAGVFIWAVKGDQIADRLHDALFYSEAV